MKLSKKAIEYYYKMTGDTIKENEEFDVEGIESLFEDLLWYFNRREEEYKDKYEELSEEYDELAREERW